MVVVALQHELERIRGIGKTAAERLQKSGIRTVEELATAKPEDLAFVKGIGTTSAKKMIRNAKEILNLEMGIEKVLESIKETFIRSCPKCGGTMTDKFLIIGPDRRINVYQCHVCKFYLPK